MSNFDSALQNCLADNCSKQDLADIATAAYDVRLSRLSTRLTCPDQRSGHLRLSGGDFPDLCRCAELPGTRLTERSVGGIGGQQLVLILDLGRLPVRGERVGQRLSVLNERVRILDERLGVVDERLGVLG